MSLNEIPGTVTFKRNWPLVTVLSLQAAILWFVFDTRTSLADLDRRAVKLEVKEEKRDAGDRQTSNDIASIKATVEAILRQISRDERRSAGDRP